MSERGEAGRAEELLRLLGPDDFLKLVERWGGVRLYMPHVASSLSRTLGRAAAEALSRKYAGSYLRVPVAKVWRAQVYRNQGLSNAEIARRLVIPETSVDRLWSRMHSPPVKGAQLDLFEIKEFDVRGSRRQDARVTWRRG